MSACCGFCDCWGSSRTFGYYDHDCHVYYNDLDSYDYAIKRRADADKSNDSSTKRHIINGAWKREGTLRRFTVQVGGLEQHELLPRPASSGKPDLGFGVGEVRAEACAKVCVRAFGAHVCALCLYESLLISIAQGGPYGENLANNFPDPTTAIDAWYNEEQEYNYEKQKFSESAGHYTQLVWKNTTKVGCGAANCNSDAEEGSNGWLFICEYDPAGHVVGEFGRNVRKVGMDEDGTPGFGVASSMTRSSGLLIALVALSSLAAVCL